MLRQWILSKSICMLLCFLEDKLKFGNFLGGVLVLGPSILCSMEVCGPIVEHFYLHWMNS